MCRVNRFMSYAVAEAFKSDEPNRHGCIIVRGRKIISRGWNKSKTHPAAKNYHSKHFHAELSAIVAANEGDLEGSDLFVCRIYRRPDGQLGMSRPCKVCMGLIKEAGIRRVYYTTRFGRIEIEKV